MKESLDKNLDKKFRQKFRIRKKDKNLDKFKTQNDHPPCSGHIVH